MACSDVKLACCRLCKKPLASNLGECIHCGVCNPIEKDGCSWLHRLLLALVLLGTVLATMSYERHPDIDRDCRSGESPDGRPC